MAIGDYTIPNTTIYLLKGCPLDKDYRHTKYFTNATQQNDYFRTLVFKTFSEQTYQRYAKGQLRIAALADDIYSANYMMFQNTNHGNKWFYAFIDSVEYVSNTVTTVYYIIDVIQTWMFDYSMGGCFVEREHSLTDKFGENLVPENLEIGEKITVSKEPIINNKYDYMLGGVVLSREPVTNNEASFVKPMPGVTPRIYGRPFRDGKTEYPIFSITPSDEITQGSGLWVVTGLLLNPEDYQKLLADDQYYNNVTTKTVGNETYISTFFTFMNDIADGKISVIPENTGASNARPSSIDDVVLTFTYPAFFSTDTAVKAGKKAYLPNFTSVLYYDIKFKNTFKINGTNYTPKNKKLLCSPYNDLTITNGNGDELLLKYENFSQARELRIFSSLYSSPVTCVIPTNYKGVFNNYRESIAQSNYPVPAFTGNPYMEWLQDNRYSWTTSLLTSAISNGFSGMQSALSRKFPQARQQVVDTYGAIAEKMAQVSDIKQKSPSVSYQGITQLLSLSISELKFYAQYEQIKPEFVLIIDDYFSMFGYATHRVKIPNVKDPSVATQLRPSWNYIQTKGCMIEPVTHKDSNGKEIVDSCVPADVERELERIYDNGITFWMPNKTVGDYTQDNSPVIT